jgi:hypothetical protein
LLSDYLIKELKYPSLKMTLVWFFRGLIKQFNRRSIWEIVTDRPKLYTLYIMYLRKSW